VSEKVSIFREVETWGTVVGYQASAPKNDHALLEKVADEVKDFLFHVDDVFSTFKPHSIVSQLRSGKISIEECSDEVRGVWNATNFSKFITDGLFDPWCVAGGYDPSGYVKGWAADRAAEMFLAMGGFDVVVNAGGDLTLRMEHSEFVGIANPNNREEVVHKIELNSGAVATSGTSERGAHIRDPQTGLIAIGASSATVWGPDGGIADALATALIVAGKDGAYLFQKPELSGYHCWVIERHSDEAWAI
jgi:FAD:protein FMN transferase